MKMESRHSCPTCGNEFAEAMEFCPVCMLREAVADGVQSGESSSEHTLRPTPVEMGLAEQSLTADDRSFILAQAALYLTTTRGYSTPEARICYEHLMSFESLDHPLLLVSA